MGGWEVALFAVPASDLGVSSQTWSGSSFYCHMPSLYPKPLPIESIDLGLSPTSTPNPVAAVTV